MLSVPKLRKVSEDDPISHEDHNELVDAIVRNTIQPGPGVELLQTDGGVIISVPFRGMVIHAVSPSTGIGVATSADQMTGADCVVRGSTSTGAIADAGYSIKIWNKSTLSAVGNSKPIMATWDGACWVSTWEECS